MDAAYDDNTTLPLVLDFGYIPVVPPRHNRLDPWQLSRAVRAVKTLASALRKSQFKAIRICDTPPFFLPFTFAVYLVFLRASVSPR